MEQLKATIETKAYSVRLLPETRNKANAKAKKNGKTFSAYLNDLLEKDLNENK
jgi:predicted DNA-binding protein